MKLSEQDKLNVAAFLSGATISLAKNKAALPLAKDDGLKNMIQDGIKASEAQIRGLQELLATHGITEGSV